MSSGNLLSEKPILQLCGASYYTTPWTKLAIQHAENMRSRKSHSLFPAATQNSVYHWAYTPLVPILPIRIPKTLIKDLLALIGSQYSSLDEEAAQSRMSAAKWVSLGRIQSKHAVSEVVSYFDKKVRDCLTSLLKRFSSPNQVLHKKVKPRLPSLRNIRILKQFTLYINKKWHLERIVRVTDFQKYAVFDERNPMPQYLVMICLEYNSRIPRPIPKLIGSLSEIAVPMPTFLMPLSLDIHPIPEMYTMKPGEIMIVDLSENYMMHPDGMVGMFPTQFDVPEGKEGGFVLGILY